MKIASGVISPEKPGSGSRPGPAPTHPTPAPRPQQREAVSMHRPVHPGPPHGPLKNLWRYMWKSGNVRS